MATSLLPMLQGTISSNNHKISQTPPGQAGQDTSPGMRWIKANIALQRATRHIIKCHFLLFPTDLSSVN